jgi:hypothetical protein
MRVVSSIQYLYLIYHLCFSIPCVNGLSGDGARARRFNARKKKVPTPSIERGMETWSKKLIEPTSASTQAKLPSPVIFDVPIELRDPSRPDPIESHVQFLSLADIYPEAANIESLFDENSSFRAALRAAARDDLFKPVQGLSEARNLQLRAPGSSLEGVWKDCGDCSHLTSVFRNYGIELEGRTFIQRLGRLCVSPPGSNKSYSVTGSWLDIVTPKHGRRRATHAWHQDSGQNQWTAMLGFPPESRFCGEGVFSHAICLSHKMVEPESPGPVVLDAPRDGTHPFGDQHVLRPVYKRGSEVMLYRDCDHIHSAPDEFNREGIWRFM